MDTIIDDELYLKTSYPLYPVIPSKQIPLPACQSGHRVLVRPSRPAIDIRSLLCYNPAEMMTKRTLPSTHFPSKRRPPPLRHPASSNPHIPRPGPDGASSILQKHEIATHLPLPPCLTQHLPPFDLLENPNFFANFPFFIETWTNRPPAQVSPPLPLCALRALCCGSTADSNTAPSRPQRPRAGLWQNVTTPDGMCSFVPPVPPTCSNASPPLLCTTVCPHACCGPNRPPPRTHHPLLFLAYKVLDKPREIFQNESGGENK